MPNLNFLIKKFFFRTIPPDFLEKTARFFIIFKIGTKIGKIPAYKKFLSESGCGYLTGKIKFIKDFKKLPLTDKKNYFIKYGIKETLFGKKVNDCYAWEHSSNYDARFGLTFWPRFVSEEPYKLKHLEITLRNLYNCDKKKTLIIIGFVMGMWPGGERVSYFAKQLFKVKGLKVSVAPSGASRRVIVDCVKAVGRFYEQIILLGNPYFLRRVIEYGEKERIPWNKLNIYLLTSAEGFSEEWREFVAEKIAKNKKESKALVVQRIISVFGLTETSGSFAVETPIANLIRRLCKNDKNLKKMFFGDVDFLPMVFQYNPFGTLMEEKNGELIITKALDQPLLRFNTHDDGKVFSFKKTMNILTEAGYDAEQLLKKENFKKGSILPFPFFFVFGRNQNILKVQSVPFAIEDTQAFLAHPELIKSNTGNFKMEVIEEKDKTERLCLTIELIDGIKSSSELIAKYKDIFCDSLQIKSFLKYYDGTLSEIAPIINLIEKGKYPFSSKEKIKHHYLKKEKPDD